MQQSWISILRRLSLGLAMLGVAGGAHAELGNPASDSAACCQLTTSLVNDVLRGKDVSGDERFFSAEGAPPNIHFLVDTSSSMRELPQVILGGHEAFLDLTTNGCENPRLDAFQVSRGWNPATVYPVPDPGTGLGLDQGFPNLFQDDKFYGYMEWGDLTNPTPHWNTREQACQSQVTDYAGTGAAEYALCLTCLSTKGYFKEHEARGRDNPPYNVAGFIFWGRFLNFNPPKYVTAKAVLKSVIKDLKRVRVGISYFTSSTPNTAMLKPQSPSCQQIVSDASAFDSYRESYIDAVNELNFTAGTPLARSLLNLGYYFTSDEGVYRDVFGFGTGYSYPSSAPSNFRNPSLSSQDRSVCWGCQVSSVIIITDGEPSGDNLSSTVVTKLRQLQGPVYCPDTASCGSGTAPGRDKGSNPAIYTDDNPQYMLDDVAKLLFEQDLQRNTPPIVGDFNTAGKQNLITYTVGFGINSNLLKHTAEVGGGLYYTADDADSLKQALLDIINSVQTRSTSFSSPAASTLQVRSASATLIPRFKPARNKTAPWQGFLYRFEQGPERLLGCHPQNPSAGGDLNQDGDCDDTLLLDAAGDAIIENDEGDFVKLLNPLTPAVPIWEAGAKLKAGGNQKWMARRIYSIVDSNADGKVDSRDTPVEFSEANASVLREYLGISQNPDVCSDLAARLGEPALSPDDCARLVIRWYRGADALNADPLLRGLDRPFLLHDIFHSSPVSVEPPAQARFCSFSQQCVSALFSGSTLQDDTSLPGGATVKAYAAYQYEAGNRDKLLLVGSNGGMLHAFHNGKALGAGEVDSLTGQSKYDPGTGEELWAFIPPDMLPKLRPNLGKHAYFVDGTPMVRDTWLDGTEGEPADGKKQWKEYRTVAVVGTGRGGVHRFALDLTRLLGRDPGDTDHRVPNQAGDFLWMWPQPCDPLALQVGESFTNYAPQPPPILPVALTDGADNALRDLSSTPHPSETSPWLIDNTPARERWVVALNGGFDEHMLRGRGMAIVDIRTGHTVWSFFHGDGQSRSEHLRYPIGAGLSVLDIGQANNALSDADKLFDSATVGDYGGQLWMVRMWKPGAWDSTKKQVNNWFAARSFRVANLAGRTGDPEALRAPFSYMTVNALQPDTGFLRTFVGTGDRENLLEKGTGCRLSNPRACAVQGCGVNNTLTIERGGSTVYTTNATYQDFHYTAGSATPASAGPACGGSRVTLTWNNDAANGCGNGNDGSLQYTCDGDSSSWSCRETANTWTALNYLQSAAPYPQRYYGVWTYGGTDPLRRFNSDAEAAAYDGSLFTDANLVNVSNFNGSGQVTSNPSASPSGKGWYLEYGVANERTGTTGTLISGCVLWSSFEPSGSSGAVCSTTGTNVARLYQANFATGEANCAQSFYTQASDSWTRYHQTSTVAAPAEPAMQVSIGGGLISIDTNQQGPGQQDTTRVHQTDEGVRSLYQLELDPRSHECRHEGVATACQ
ncbi:pilus assembly protein PilY [Hyalangium sp.]|uniref:pilus assembly protein PilY n=1 Tax=Hyalangium sp. TaxID=2028555 RepID=UPI002D27C19F|nr:pilus assembly protein PilY [Hyalangium sp.]HYH98797.1 pilus assembly protein PilY [Hyalangium sp.]